MCAVISLACVMRMHIYVHNVSVYALCMYVYVFEHDMHVCVLVHMYAVYMYMCVCMHAWCVVCALVCAHVRVQECVCASSPNLKTCGRLVRLSYLSKNFL